jgi:hypothetical protein
MTTITPDEFNGSFILMCRITDDKLNFGPMAENVYNALKIASRFPEWKFRYFETPLKKYGNITVAWMPPHSYTEAHFKEYNEIIM